jgi:hypothetical protein
MRYERLFPLAVFAFIAACSSTDSARTPTGPGSVTRPSAAISLTTDPANAPSGTHLQTGSISCTVGPSPSFAVTCASFELAGVGHTNADVSLVAHYTADVLCSNKGVNPNNSVEPQSTSLTATDDFTATSSKNGRLTVRSASASPTTGGNPCPNPNWTPTFTNITLVDFTYSVTFAGFENPYILITGP